MRSGVGKEIPAVQVDEESCVLVIETSTPEATVALVWPNGRVEQRGFQSDRSHNALLFEPLKELLAQLSDECSIGLVLVGSGPGSYSGTRVGIAAAQGVAIALGCQAIAVPSILAVAPVVNGKQALAIGDARRGSYWYAEMQESRLDAMPALCDLDELVARIQVVLAAGGEVFSFEDSRRFEVPDLIKEQIQLMYPDAQKLWEAWRCASLQAREAWANTLAQPIYLKPPHITPGKKASFF